MHDPNFSGLTLALGEQISNWTCFNPYLNCYARLVFSDTEAFVVQPQIEEYVIKKNFFSKLSSSARYVARLVCYNPGNILAHFSNTMSKARNKEFKAQNLTMRKVRYYLVETHGWTHMKCIEVFHELRDFISRIEKE